MVGKTALASKLLRTLILGTAGAASLACASMLVGAGCSFPDYVIASLDGGDAEVGAHADGSAADVTSPPPDTVPPSDVTYVKDGAVCTGHDEDEDGVPDSCDNCPNIANPGQEGGEVGDACLPPNDLLSAPTNGFFDPFVTWATPPWQQFVASGNSLSLAPAGDAVEGGTTTDSYLRFYFAPAGSGSTAVSVTTVLHILAAPAGGAPGVAGLLLRGAPGRGGAPSAQAFVLCAVDLVNGFVAAATPPTGCEGGACGPATLLRPGSSSANAQAPLPASLPHAIGAALGLRATITTGSGGSADAGAPGAGTLECRVFDPARPETAVSTDPSYSVRGRVGPSIWTGFGSVGLLTLGTRSQFDSLQVVRGK